MIPEVILRCAYLIVTNRLLKNTICVVRLSSRQAIDIEGEKLALIPEQHEVNSRIVLSNNKSARLMEYQLSDRLMHWPAQGCDSKYRYIQTMPDERSGYRLSGYRLDI